MPIPDNRMNICGGHGASLLLSFMDRQKWAYAVVRRRWSIGYKAGPIIALFNAIPLRLRSAIAAAIAAVQRGTDADPPEPSHECAADDAEWEQDAVHGYMRARFDPATQACVHLAANARAAALLGLRREELLARFARCDAPLALPPLDAVRAFIHGLRDVGAAAATRYYRIVPPPPAHPPPCSGVSAQRSGEDPEPLSPPPPVLVHAHTVRVFDAYGRLVEVRVLTFAPQI
jgi:hypothetical protein